MMVKGVVVNLVVKVIGEPWVREKKETHSIVVLENMKMTPTIFWNSSTVIKIT